MDAFRPRPGLGKVMAAPVDGGETGWGEDGSRQRDRTRRGSEAAGCGRTWSLLLLGDCCHIQVMLKWGCEPLVRSLHLLFAVLMSRASWGPSQGPQFNVCGSLLSLTASPPRACHLILISCLLGLNAGLDEAQAGIKIARRNVSNLRYADDTTLMEEVKRN